MMAKDAVPYLVYKKINGWFTTSFDCRVATPLEVSTAMELDYSPLCEQFVVFAPLKKQQSLKISIEVLDDFIEQHACFNQSEKGRQYQSGTAMVNFLHSSIQEGSPVLFNFQEVFLLQDGKVPPAHYRVGIDLCAHDLEAYTQVVSKFSYQLLKMFFSSFYRNETATFGPGQVNLNNYVHGCWGAIGRPLNLVESFSGVVEAYYVHVLDWKMHHPRDYELVTFESSVSVDDLKWFIESLVDNQRELIIVLRGIRYQDPLERLRVEEAMSNIKCNRLLQLILLTDENTKQSLIDLAPPKIKSKAIFTELREGAGYYLNSPKVFSAIYRQIQSRTVKSFEQLYLNNEIKPPVNSKTYVYGDKEKDDFRQTKRFNRQDLKAKVTLSLTQQVAAEVTEQVAAEQVIAVNQAQQHTENLSKTQSQALEHSSYWSNSDDFDEFCKKLHSFVVEAAAAWEKSLAAQNEVVFYTEHYHRVRAEFFGRLEVDEAFRIKFAAGIFGLANTQSSQGLSLPNYSVNAIDRNLAESLTCDIAYFRDGVNPNRRTISSTIFSRRTLAGIQYESPSLLKFDPTMYDKISYMSCYTNDTHGYQDHLNYYVLLNEEMLENLSIEDQAARITLAEALLSILKPGVAHEKVMVFEEAFLELIGLYFKDNEDYLRVLKQFMLGFEVHHIDNLKIMLQVLIRRHRSGMEEFLKLLSYLESRCLLSIFYKIYFKYAQTILSVAELLDHPKGVWIQKKVSREGSKTIVFNSVLDLKIGAFVSLMLQVPEVLSFQDLPVFDKLCCHFIVFAARHNMPILNDELDKLDQLWRRIYSKIFIYTGSQADYTDALMKCLAQNLMAREGLSIAPLGMADTFFAVLEQLIDHAILKGMLEEQINEIGTGLSFAWMDVPYAIAQNGFHVVSSEMALHSELINPITKRYSVSFAELNQCLIQRDEVDLIQATFRYLGTERHREDLSYYREVLKTIFKPQSMSDEVLYEDLFTYFVLMSTGIHYTKALNETQFRHDFISFYKENRGKQSKSLACLLPCLDRFFDVVKLIPRDAERGMTSLWRLWVAENKELVNAVAIDIPEVLTKKFEQQQLMRFMAMHVEALEQCEAFLEQDSAFVYALVQTQFTNKTHAHYNKTSISLLKAIYPELPMTIFLKDIEKIDRFMERYKELVELGIRGLVFLEFKKIFMQCKDMDIALILTDVLRENLVHNNTDYAIECGAQFLNLVAGKPKLLSNLSITANLLISVLAFNTTSQQAGVLLPQSLALCETLMSLGEVEAARVLKCILPYLTTSEVIEFLEHHTLNALQLQGIADILEYLNEPLFVLPIVRLNLTENTVSDFSELGEIIKDMPKEHIKALFSLSTFICSPGNYQVRVMLQQLKQLPLLTLQALARFQSLHAVEVPQLLEILNSISILDSLQAFEHQSYAQNLERYDYDRAEIIEKISKIKHKSHTTEEAQILSQETQQQLLDDYIQLMSYMVARPILIEKNEAGQQEAFTINQLNEAQFQMVYQRLSHQMINEEQIHGHELMLLALGCEALYRTHKKFPRNTQILSVLNSLYQGGNLISEMKTGQGKSIVAALMGVLLCASGRTVDVITENSQLAMDGLTVFKLFYHYLGISCGDAIIEADSPYCAYIANGINYSTASSLALFRAQMLLEKKVLPQNISLVADEIDAALTTTVQYRLAATLDPLSRNTRAWSIVYGVLLDFVREQDIFIKNKCSKKEDISNFRNYFLLQSNKKEMITFMAELPDELLGELIDCAMVAHELEENIDYMIVKTLKNKPVYYAAPILDSTKRPDSKVSFSEGLQQLLHIRLNRIHAKRKLVFDIEPCGETLVVISAKNFFDDYRLKGGRIIGFTGTAGTSIELNEFYQYNGLTAYVYPTYVESQSIDLGLFWAFGLEAHQLKILEQIRCFKSEDPTQPLLVITSSAKATDELHAYISKHSDWLIQRYNGYAVVGVCEEGVIHKAGMVGMITIANESLARGADFQTTHSKGLKVINTCTDITENDLLQIQGRVARNGQQGQYCSIIDASDLGTPLSSLEEISSNFKIHRIRIACGKQEMRFKMRLLEDVRYHIVSHYFLRLRGYADKLLGPQLGLSYSLVDSSAFHQDLRDFNQRAEDHYNAILNSHVPIEGTVIETFFEARILDYQKALNRWIPVNRFQTLNVIEPLIPLDKLRKLTLLNDQSMDQLAILSGVFSTVWKYYGHQQMQANLLVCDQMIDHFQPYFNEEVSFRQALADYLQQQQLLDIEKAHSTLTDLEKQLKSFTGLFQSIPLIGRFISVETIHDFLSDYFQVTHCQIEEKKWDDIALPKVDFSGISLWMNRISKLMTVGGLLATGPIPFVVNRILIPTIAPWIKTSLNRSGASSLEILAGIGDITTDLSNALIGIFSLQNLSEMTVGDLLDKVSPLLNNKAFLKIVSMGLDINELNHLSPYLKMIPELMKVFDPYKAERLTTLLNADVLLFLLQKGSEFEFIKQLVDQTEFKTALPRLLALRPDFIKAFKSISFPDFLGLVKVMAHPKFDDFIKQLPENARFADLVVWLNSDLQAVPDEIKLALSELRHYQSDRERIEDNTRQFILKLRDNFDLNQDKLKAGLNKLAVKAPVIPPLIVAPEVIEVQKTSWFKYGAFLAAIMCVLAFNIFYFSMLGLSTSVVLIGWGLFSLFSEPLAPKRVPTAQNEAVCIIEVPVLPIEVLKEIRRQERPKADVLPSPSSIHRGYAHYGVFGLSNPNAHVNLIESVNVVTLPLI